MGKLIAILFLFTLTGCVPLRAAKEIEMRDCIRSITGNVAEYGRPDEFVPRDEQWHLLSQDHRKEVFSRSKTSDCLGPGDVPMEKKYQLAVRSRNEFGFEIRVWLTGENFKE